MLKGVSRSVLYTMKLFLQKPFSAGLFLTYRCTGECRHCMYAASPRWPADWIDEHAAEQVLEQLAERMVPSYPPGFEGIGINYGLHFTGGEPFLNYKLLLRLVGIAAELGIPGTFVETNCYWCTDPSICRERFLELREAGLRGVLISVNPFIQEHVPFERVELAVEEGRKVFGPNVLVYQENFYELLHSSGVKGTVPLEETLHRWPGIIQELELLPMGRVPYRLSHLYQKYPARAFGGSCLPELSRGWHFHIDNYLNYLPGFCGGISLGSALDMDSLYRGIDLSGHPVLRALVSGGARELYEFAKRYGYTEKPEGYISKCHLCVDVRRFLVEQAEFSELQPREFYKYL